MTNTPFTAEAIAGGRAQHDLANRPSAPRLPSLRRNFSWTLIGNVVYAGCQWAMLMVLAEIGSPEMVGQFALGLAIAAPLMMFANLNLRGVQATDANKEYQFAEYLGLRLVTTTLALLTITGIAVAGGYGQGTVLVIVAVGLAKSFDSLSDVFYGLLQQQEWMDCIAKSLMIQGPLVLITLCGAVYLTDNVLWGVSAWALVSAMVFAGYDVQNGRRVLQANQREDDKDLQATVGKAVLKPSWGIGALLRLGWLALPMGLVMMLISLNANLPRYFIARSWGERELGVFAAMAYVLVAGSTVTNALGQSASPRLAKYYATGNRYAFRLLLAKLIGVGALVGAVVFAGVELAGEEILTFIYTPEYAREVHVFGLLTLATALGGLSSFLGYAITAARQFRVQLTINIITTLFLLLGCWMLIPTHGSLGAAIAIISAAILKLLIFTLVIRQILSPVITPRIRS